MNKQQELFEKAYFNKLNPSEQSAFEEKLLQNSQFARDYEDFCSTLDVLDTLEFSEDVIRLTEQEDRLPWVKKPITWFISAAALIAILIFSGILKTSDGWNVDKDLIEFPDLYTVRNGMSSVPEKVSEAMYHYNAEDFEKVISLLKEIDIKNDTLSMYLGISYLKIQEYKSALAVIQGVDNGAFMEETLYYGGVLNYLLNRKNIAISLWRQLPASSLYLKDLPLNIRHE